ncbi:MAG: ABC transporter permease [Promethearchaeota archaeon]
MGVTTAVEPKAINHRQFISRDENAQLNLVIPSFREQLKEIKDQKVSFLVIPRKKNEFYAARKAALTRLKPKRRFISKLGNPLTILGLVIVFFITTWAVFAPLIAQYEFMEVIGVNNDVASWTGPTADHILGTTKFGRDVYSRLIWGARISLTLGFFPLIISAGGGAIFGLIGGYFGGLVDSIIMRATDIILAFPNLILVILTVSTFGYSITNVLLVFGILGISGFARLIRGGVLKEKDKTYVQAAKVSGSSDMNIMFKHIMPNVVSPVIIAFSFGIGGNILSLAALSFLGVTGSLMCEWGADISFARAKLYEAPWAAFAPGIGVSLAVVGFMLLGDGLRDALDPKINHAK